MKTKLKYLLFWLLTLVSLSSSTYALTLFNTSLRQDTYYSNSHWYTLEKNSDSSYRCINVSISTSPWNWRHFIKGDPICEDWIFNSLLPSSSFFSSSVSTFRASHTSPYYMDIKKTYLFTLNMVDVDWQIKVHKNKFKFSSSWFYTIKSKRWSNVFANASLWGPWLTFVVNDDDRVRWATYVNNMYMLDWFAFVLYPVFDSFVFDSYNNKAYRYSGFYSWDGVDVNHKDLRSKLYNTVPTSVSDIQRNVGADYSVAYAQGQKVNFSLVNTRPWTKEDLKLIQQDLVNSLTNLNEYSSYYLWMTPEEFEWLIGKKTNSSDANSGQSWDQCIAKYINMRALTAHSDWCFGKDYNNEERMKYWHDVIDDSDDKYTTRDKTRYRRCYMFANYKSGLKKKLWEARDPFRKEWKSEYLGLEAKDVNPELLCGSKPSSSKKDEDYSYFAKPENNPALKAWDWLRWRRWEPALTTEKWEKLYAVDFEPDFSDLRSLYWQCQGLDRFGIAKNSNQTPEQKQKACSEYAAKKAEVSKKWEWAKLWDFYWNTVNWAISIIEKKKNQDWLITTLGKDVKESLSEGWEALLNSVKVPFNSWYNAILPLKCSNNTHIEMMDYILWGLFAILAFTFFRML